jgi:predicted transcriptional regulator YdeE
MNQETRIERLGPMDLIGVTLYGNPRVVEFSVAWEHFGKVADEAAISRVGKDLYGLQIYPPWFPERFELTYMASIARGSLAKIPARMVMKTIPPGQYAVQKVAGGVSNIDRALQYLYQEYIPRHGYRVAMPIDFEKYCNVPSHNSDPVDIEVWVPIKGK